MYVYIPVYDRGWYIATVPAGDLKRITGHLLNYRGTIYHDDILYTSEQAAQRYIYKLPSVPGDRYIMEV